MSGIPRHLSYAFFFLLLCDLSQSEHQEATKPFSGLINKHVSTLAGRPLFLDCVIFFSLSFFEDFIFLNDPLLITGITGDKLYFVV